MARINTNVGAIIANTNLQKSQAALNTSLQRLSSGLRINSGADDPAGLIAGESLQSEIQGINTAIANSTQATNVISTADAALGEVSNLLISIKGLVVQAANTGAMSSDEIQANQLQVDSAIASITRISNSTTFGGLQLLNGSLGYITSGVTTSAIHDLSINSAAFGTAATIPVVVNVVTSAQPASLKFLQSSISTDVTLDVAGATGTQELHLRRRHPLLRHRLSDQPRQRFHGRLGIAEFRDQPVLGHQLHQHRLRIQPVCFGRGGRQQQQQLQHRQQPGVDEQRSVGRDVVATINGEKASGSGQTVSLNTPNLSLSLNLDNSFGLGTEQFTITGGGAVFQLGSQVQSNQQVSIGIGSVAASKLGDAQDGYLTDLVTGGDADLSTDPAKASSIIDAAINQVSELRGRLGAFEANTLQTNINSQQVALENVTASESSIMDTDFAAETSNLTRDQILVQAGTSVLATANTTPQSVLTLLQGH